MGVNGECRARTTGRQHIVVSCTLACTLCILLLNCFKAFAEDILEELRTKAAMAEEVHLLSWSFFSWKS